VVHWPAGRRRFPSGRPVSARHIHMCLSIPPKYSVAHTIVFLKGKSAVRIHASC